MIFNSVLTIDGIPPSELGLGVFRNSQRPILSSTVDNTVTIPGMHGAYDFGATMGPKQFELECAFIEKNHMELQQRASALAAFLLDGDGRPRTMDIVFANSPDRKYSVRYVGSLNIDRISGLGTFTLPFTAFDPFAYSVTSSLDVNVDSEILVDSDINVDISYSHTIYTPQTITVFNYGNQNAQPVITIRNEFSTLSLSVGGVEFTYNTYMNGVLEIDFKRKTVSRSGVNLLKNTNARFGKIPVGESQILVNGTGLNMIMDIQFNYKYA